MNRVMGTFERSAARTLESRLKEPRRFIQVVAGPRQVGKTTVVRTVLGRSLLGHHYASADEPTLKGPGWIEAQWEAGRFAARDGGGILAIDEIQKIPNWSETVKRLWDDDTHSGSDLRVVLLGSAPLVLQKGLTESLAGRFEVLPLTHWTFAEMATAFGWGVEQFVFHGGYPGAAPLIAEPERWRRYIVDSLIETTISRDVLLLSRVDKPALLRRTFELGCRYSGQVLSYTKMLGQLQDAGNTTTIAHYLELLAASGLVTGLQKYAGQTVRQRGSSPKLQVLNTALITAQSGLTFPEARRDPVFWGRLTESAVGAHLLAAAATGVCEVYYWRGRDREVDFVVRSGKRLFAIEVKSSGVRASRSGLDQFTGEFKSSRKMIVGADGIPIEKFLSTSITSSLGE